MDVTKLKVPQLREELKKRGLESTGLRNDLVERLANAIKNEADFAPSSAMTDNTAVESTTESIESIPVSTLVTEEQVAVSEDVSSASVSEAVSAVSAAAVSPSAVAQTEDERRKKRAERFGTAATDMAPALTDEKKKKRAEKFGLTESAEEEARRKKRADRFGTATVEAVPVVTDEKKKKRAERFGLTESAAEEEKKKRRSERFSK